jgi:hypothetical protein
MQEPFLNFQKFYDREIAFDLAERLRSGSVAVTLEDDQSYFDVSFAHDPMQHPVWVKVQAKDFTRAAELMEDYYTQQLDSVPADYYLYGMDNDELMEIVKAPDQWGYLDHPLAVRILKHRGFKLTDAEVDDYRKASIRSLAEPERGKSHWIWMACLISLLIWPAGVIAGGLVTTMKKTLPDGRRVFVYSANDRKWGKWILLIAAGAFLFWLKGFL